MEHGYFKVRNFEKFQHYKHRNPAWIKLYPALLDDYDFSCLQDASKWLAIGLFLLASRTDNQIPADQAWIAGRLHLTSSPDLQSLVDARFIEADDLASKMLAACKQNGGAEKRREEKRREEIPSACADGSSGSSGKQKAVSQQGRPQATTTNGNHQAAIDLFCNLWKQRHGTDYSFHGGRDGKAVKFILADLKGDMPMVEAVYRAYLADASEFVGERHAHSLSLLQSQLHAYKARVAERSKPIQRVTVNGKV